MASGSVTSSTYQFSDGTKSITLYWSQERDIPNNRSIITWNLNGSGTSGQWGWAGPFNVNIDGEFHSSIERIQLSNGTLVMSGTTYVNHHNDGTRSFTISISAAIYTSAINVSGSQTFTLDSIPRENKVTVSDTEIGKTCNISISKSVSTYTTTLSWALYKNKESSTVLASDTLITKTANTTVSMEIPETFYSLLPDTPTGYIIISWDTYNGDTKVGSTKTTSFYVTMPDSVYPKVTSSNVINTDPITSEITGSTGFIKGAGYVTVSGLGQVYQSATLVKLEVTNGSQIIQLPTDNSTVNINNPDNPDFIFTVTDSRGFTGSATVTLSMADYITPNIIVENAKMSLYPEDITRALITVDVSGIGFNKSFGQIDNAFTIDYSLTDEDGNITTITKSGDLYWNEENTSYSATGVELVVNKTNSAYSIVATIKDIINVNGVNSNTVVVTRIPSFDWSKTDFNFNVPIKYKNISLCMPIYFEVDDWQVIYDPITHRVECLTRMIEDNLDWSANDSYFSSTSSIPMPDYPFAFLTAPILETSFIHNIGKMYLTVFGTLSTSTHSIVVQMGRPTGWGLFSDGLTLVFKLTGFVPDDFDINEYIDI